MPSSASTQLFDFGLNSQLSENMDDQLHANKSHSSAVDGNQISFGNSVQAQAASSSALGSAVNCTLAEDSDTHSETADKISADPGQKKPSKNAERGSKKKKPIREDTGFPNIDDSDNTDSPVIPKARKGRSQLLKAKRPQTVNLSDIEEIVIDDSTPAPEPSRVPKPSRLARKKRQPDSKNGTSNESEDQPGASSGSSKMDSAKEDSDDDFVVSSYNARKRLRIRKK